MRIAIASFDGVPPDFRDDERVVAALRERRIEVDAIPWDRSATRWEEFDAVVVRSTWDYARRRDEFLAWADTVGERLHNAPPLIRWNSDKHYLADLEADGIGVVPTRYVAPGEPAPELEGEVVIKPTISAGGRDTGRFGPAVHDEALALIGAIQASGRTAMVQPFMPVVDTIGETAVLMIDGEFAHALRKRAVLRPDEVAPVRDDAIGAAETMYDPGLVTPTEATDAELEHARAVVADLAERFDYMPLYARVDTIPGPDGAPLLLELEAVEPNFYLGQVPATTDVVAEAIIRRAGRGS
jgi:glutathione synthase/RimK-type ligase-like ATP-grasp enzyme